MRYIKTILVFIFLSVYFSALAGVGQQDNDPVFAFSIANESYRNGDFAKAYDQYKILVDSGRWQSPELYFNLGNAAFKLNKKAEAILNYERAKRLAPSDEDIIYNLELVNSQLQDKIDIIPDFFAVRFLHSVRDVFSERNWACITITCFIAILLFIWLYLFGNKFYIKKTASILSICAAVLFVVAFAAGMGRKYYMKDDTGAIIGVESLTVRSAPDVNSTHLFILHEGTRVSIKDEVGEWREIRMNDGAKGWVQINDLLII